MEFIQGVWVRVKSGDLDGKVALFCTEESRDLRKGESAVCKKLGDLIRFLPMFG